VNELALTESPSLRRQYADRVDVLDKVKALTFFPDGQHVDTPGVAAYFEVTPDVIKKVVQRNRKELEGNGLRVLRGDEYREFARTNSVVTEGGDFLSLASSQNTVTVFTRRTILNVGQLLTESEVAEAVRTRLLDVEEEAREQHLLSLDAQPIRVPLEPTTFPLSDAVVLMRQKFGVRVPVAELTRILRAGGVLRQDGKPKAEYQALFWHTGSAYEVFGHAIEPLYRRYESTKIRLEMAAQMRLPMEPPGWPELPLLPPTP
jgi:hypothetical protein